MRIDLELDGTPDAPARARDALDRLAAGLAPGRLGDARLLVSELVTNAVRHAGLRAGQRVRLVAALEGRALRIEVHDPGGGFEPRAPSPNPARASGWGLVLVRELADRWGVESGPRTLVWFEMDPAGGELAA